MDLSPEQEAAIKDIAERYMARRARGVKTGAAVQRNNWTKGEALIHAARNDLRSQRRTAKRSANKPPDDPQRIEDERCVQIMVDRLERLIAEEEARKNDQ